MSARHSHARARAQTRARRGFSLGEVMIALVVFGVIMSATFAFLLGQSKSFRSISAKSAAIQNGRFGRDVMRQELRTAGTNVTVDQPVIVFANDSTFAYNSDLTTNTKDSTGFTSAVYVDPFATNAQVSAIALANAITIPGSSPSFSYPLADYGGSGVSAEAELVVFRFTRDTASSNSLDYMLLRQINAGAAEVIATGLRRSQAVPFFRYWYDPTRYSLVLTALDTIPRSWLPLAKTVAMRGSGADTGTAITTRIDQVRSVEVTYEVTAPIGSKREVVRYMVPMPNAAVARQERACGRPPISPTAPAPVWNSAQKAVLLTWNKATDDGAGEKDAVRYVLLRRLTGAASWGDPVATISAVSGVASYAYKDAGVQTGSATSYQYALAVQDCTPNLSGFAISSSVVVP